MWTSCYFCGCLEVLEFRWLGSPQLRKQRNNKMENCRQNVKSSVWGEIGGGGSWSWVQIPLAYNMYAMFSYRLLLLIIARMSALRISPIN